MNQLTMAASRQFSNHQNQVFDSLENENRHARRSTALISLHKIIDLIISSPSPLLRPCEISSRSSLRSPIDDSDLNPNDAILRNRALPPGFDFDLNISPNVTSETESTEFPADCGCVSAPRVSGLDDVELCNGAGVSDEGQCDAKSQAVGNGDESAAIEEVETTEDVSKTTKLQVRSSEIDNNGGSEESKCEVDREIEENSSRRSGKEERDEGYLGLLIEAAKLIFGDVETESKKAVKDEFVKSEGEKKFAEIENGNGNGNGNRRSKRVRRTQVLPYRYRDSVIEPLKKQRSSSSTAVPTPTKRRSR